MATNIQLLIIEDSEDDALLLLRELQNSGYEPNWERVDTPEAMKAALAAQEWDAVVSDFSMPCFNGLDALRMVKESGLDIPFIIVSGKIGEETAVKAMRSGAHDYIIKGNLARLAPAIEREMGEAEIRRKRRQAVDALRESEGRYRVLLESVTDYIYTTLVKDGIPIATLHSPGCAAVTGYSNEDYNSDPDLWLRMVHEDDRAAVLEQANNLLAGKASSSLEHRIIHKEGRVCWIRNTPVPRHDLNGRLIAFDGIVTDITERKQYEEELAKSKKEWERTFDAIIDPVMILDTDHRIIKANKAMAEKVELTPSETKGQPCYKVIHQTLEPPDYCPCTRLMEDGQPHVAEFHSPSLGGYFSSSVSPLFGPGGELHGSICIVRDINERKAADEALKREKEFLRHLLQGSAVATFVLDPKHRVLLWNQACEKLTGVLSTDVLGTSLHWRAFYTHERPCLADIIIEGRMEQLQQLYAHESQSMLVPGGIQAEGRYPDLNGSDRYLLFNAAPIRNGDGTLLGAIETVQDISEQKILEAQLFQAQKMEAIGQLAGGIAHDFNNILTVIIGFSTLINMAMDADDPQKANLTNVLAAADKAVDLTRSLLTFSRKQEINPGPVDLNQIIRKIDKFLKRIIGEDIVFRTTLSQDVVTVNADSGQIEQVLMNLATNARDAMPIGGLLSIDTGTIEVDDDYIKAHGSGEPGWYVCISVSDSGEGMDESTCKKVFEPFFTTKEVGKGTGLGLSMVFGIIKQHNGFINVESEPGKGTTFRILLPLIQSTVVEKHVREEEVNYTGAETILVADDDPSVLDLTVKALGMFGYTVISAVNGKDALAKFEENQEKINLVIMDIIMPEISGKDAFDKMRMINPDIKGFFMSGYTSDIIKQRGMLEEVSEFIQKPLNLKQLLTKVRDVLEKHTMLHNE